MVSAHWSSLPPEKLQFDEDVGASISSAQFKLINRTTNTQVSAPSLSVTYDPAILLATVTFAQVGGPPLPDGDYRLTLSAGSVTDAAGNPLATDFTFDFFVLAGDANHDREVGLADLVAVAQNYGGTSKTYAQGDFNGDGTVDFADLVVEAQQYGANLPSLAAPPALAASVSTPTTVSEPLKSLFSVAPVTRPIASKPKLLARPSHAGKR